MTAPPIASSTREERLAFVRSEWKCLHNCELCGKCHVLRGRSETELYADYIEGKREYLELTLAIRNPQFNSSKQTDAYRKKKPWSSR